MKDASFDFTVASDYERDHEALKNTKENQLAPEHAATTAPNFHNSKKKKKA